MKGQKAMTKIYELCLVCDETNFSSEEQRKTYLKAIKDAIHVFIPDAAVFENEYDDGRHSVQLQPKVIPTEYWLQSYDGTKYGHILGGHAVNLSELDMHYMELIFAALDIKDIVPDYKPVNTWGISMPQQVADAVLTFDKFEKLFGLDIHGEVFIKYEKDDDDEERCWRYT